MNTISIIGVGRVGGAFALALDSEGYPIDNLFARDSQNANDISKQIESKPFISGLSGVKKFDSDIVIICTQDAEIENIVHQLKEEDFEDVKYVFHTSGSLSSELLSDLKKFNCAIGSIHPLVSVSDSELGVKRFRDAYFCVEGDAEAIKMAEQIVRDLGGKSFTIDSKYKTLYHASAVMACGHIVALIDASMEMLQKCGLEAGSAKEILMPLIKSTINNLEVQKNSEALTGTFARADLKTLERHLETIEENSSKPILEIYLNLGERSLNLAKEQGIETQKLDKMSKKISLAKKNLKC